MRYAYSVLSVEQVKLHMISRMTIHCDSVAAQSSFSRSKLYLSVNYFQEMDLHSVPANPWEHACTLSPDTSKPVKSMYLTSFSTSLTPKYAVTSSL